MTARSDVLFITEVGIGSFLTEMACPRHVCFPPIATIQRTSGEVRFVLFRKWDGVRGRDLLQVAEPSQVGVFKCDFFGPPRSRSAFGYA